MSTFERGPADEFEVVWRSGHIDRFFAHQVTYHGVSIMNPNGGPTRINFHGEDAGRWTLVLSALEDDLLSIRNVTRASGDVS